jgi:hypothetical protein
VAGSYVVPGGTSLGRSVRRDCSGVVGTGNSKLGHGSAGGVLGLVVIEASLGVIEVVIARGKEVWVVDSEACTHYTQHDVTCRIMFPPSHCGHMATISMNYCVLHVTWKKRKLGFF